VTQFVPTRRTALLLRTGSERHLFFVLTDPHGEPPAVLIANASTVPRKYVPYDKTCILQGSDHRFLDRPSYIAYQFSEIVFVKKIAQGVLTGDMKPMAAISEECCARICAGVLTSPAVPLKCKRFYQAATGSLP
jgi:hypothetical protein